MFSVPIFIYSPMGDLFPPPAPPFGLALNLWLFFLASAAILYPVWPFCVAAWREFPATECAAGRFAHCAGGARVIQQQ